MVDAYEKEMRDYALRAIDNESGHKWKSGNISIEENDLSNDLRLQPEIHK